MPLSEDAIQPGQCYATGGDENYKVVNIARGIITYQVFLKGQRLQLLRINTGLKAFAAAVTKEIACPETA